MNANIKKVLLVILAVIGIHTADSFASSSKEVETSTGDLYGYDYRHPLPADYIYRTGQTYKEVKENGKRKKEDAKTEQGIESEANREPEAHLATVVKNIVGQLFSSKGEEDLKESVVAVSTLVNLNNLYRTSALGRYLGEQLLGELHRARVEVIDVRKTPGLMISQENGEYSLSRDMDELSYVHQADAVLVGTYTFVDERLFINVRLLSSADGLVLASASAESPVGSIISQFLADESMPVAPAKPIEVRTLVD